MKETTRVLYCWREVDTDLVTDYKYFVREKEFTLFTFSVKNDSQNLRDAIYPV
ncbi:MAG: hypothetical protein IJ896_08520 [Fibrobacter sp.]|nr:hypothetical protein [Fibrobacter sp.]